MNLNNRLQAFTELGNFLQKFTAPSKSFTETEAKFAPKLENCIRIARQHNGWFTSDDIHFSLKTWGATLTAKNLESWVAPYQLQEVEPKTVAIIMAGNIPLVGFHDFICVLMAGHKALVKQSSKDKHLLPCISDFLITLNPEFKNRIEFTDKKLENFDAVIATGSNNTARYFEYYFSKKPNIIRRNRNSIALLRGTETKEELENLGEDIFRYFGLGCRNVSKLYVPEDYNFSSFFEALFPWNPIINHHKYANNYDYNKAVYLMSEFKILENGFLLLKEEKGYGSPIACLFYEFYKDEQSIRDRLSVDKDQVQCVVGSRKENNEIPFGRSQLPGLNDYADGVDTLAFLKNF